jgi:hypothetical protein
MFHAAWTHSVGQGAVGPTAQKTTRHSFKGMKPTSMSRIGIFGFDLKIDIGVRANLVGGSYRLPNLRKLLALLTFPTAVN